MSLYKTYKSGEEEFDEYYPELLTEAGEVSNNIKQFRKQEYISIIKGEIERLEGELDIQIKVQEKAKEVFVVGRARVAGMVADKYTRIGKIEILKDQISHLQSELKAIEEDK